MKKMLTAVVVVLGMLGLGSTSVEAQMMCKERSEVLEQLKAGYGEVPVAVGLASNGALIEVLKSSEGLTWTIIITQPNGVSCVMATGESWQNLEEDMLDNDPAS